MNPPRLLPLTKRYKDRSTSKAFTFSFYCDRCGKEWRSAPQAVDPGGRCSDIRVYRMLRGDQHKAAYEQANLDAISAFSLCPACERRLCMECYYRSETQAADICQDCLRETETRSGGDAHD